MFWRDRQIGATGAVLTTWLLHSMKRDGLRRGIVTLCIDGRQGIELALESIWRLGTKMSAAAI